MADEGLNRQLGRPDVIHRVFGCEADSRGRKEMKSLSQCCAASGGLVTPVAVKEERK
jgi:hypothetical protein